MISVASQKLLILFAGAGKNQVEPGLESMGDAPVLLHCSLLRNPWPKATVVLEHCREGKTNCWFSIFRGVSFCPHPQCDEGCQCVFLSSQSQFLWILGTFWIYYAEHCGINVTFMNRASATAVHSMEYKIYDTAECDLQHQAFCSAQPL